VRTVIDANSLWDLNVIRYLFRVYGGVGYSPKSKTLGFDERFSLGGASSLRGFSRNRVGPANRSLRTQIDFPDYIQPSINDIALRKEPTLWVPTGGDYMIMLSQELHFPLERFGYESSSWIVFMDAGRVSFISNDIVTDSIDLSLDPIIRYSMGTGMRYSTAIGPLAVDIAVNPNPIKRKEERYLYFHGSLGAF
jgi:outer membrane protein assembly factor BamA